MVGEALSTAVGKLDTLSSPSGANEGRGDKVSHDMEQTKVELILFGAKGRANVCEP